MFPKNSSSDNLHSRQKYTILFTLDDTSGSLEKVLRTFINFKVSLSHIGSRPSKNSEWEYDFMTEFFLEDTGVIEELSEALKENAKNVTVISANPAVHNKREHIVPWFPRRMADLDALSTKVLEFGAELSADHPGFTDQEYRKRRAEITAIARTYRANQLIPCIEYTDLEKATWKTVYEKLISLYPTHACKEHQYVFPLLIQNCGYGPDNIPQLQNISEFLKECTGFTLRPVMGLLSSRDFLNGLAFRVFHSTQYIRHHSKPFYTPEPDVCHELLGHVPLFADPDFAAFSQEIGLCSLGASDDDIEKLATIYWFTVEFGLCRQGDHLRAYGAGLLSSFGELQYCLSNEPQVQSFDPARAAIQEYPITNYQPLYFVADSFVSAQNKVREFAASLRRPFSVRYNPFTQTIEVLDNREKIIQFTANISSDIQILKEAIAKLGSHYTRPHSPAVAAPPAFRNHEHHDHERTL